MGQGLTKARLIDRFALEMRRFSALHRFGRWFRRTLVRSVLEGFWEFARCFFAEFHFGPPRGVFSLYRTLRAGWPPLQGRIHLHDQGVPQVLPDSLLVRSGLKQYNEQPWPIFWTQLRDARLVTESLAYLGPDKLLAVESVYNEGRWRDDPASRYFTLPKPVTLKGNWTSIISYWVPTVGVPIYGHWLFNGLPRLGFLPEFPPDTGILIPAELKPYHRETLEMWGVWDRCRLTSERHLIVENFYFSAPTSLIACYDPYGGTVVRDALLPKRDRSFKGPKKFYFRRTGKRRSITNDEEICEFFRRKGWAVVNDVELTFGQTVSLFHDAEALCSMMGSNMTNALFCSPGCTVMQIVLDTYLDGWLDWLAQERKLNYHSHVFPVGGPLAPPGVIAPDAIEAFFAEAGVRF